MSQSEIKTDMCGIAGIINFSDNVRIQSIRKMTEAIKHRGPDDEGIYIDGNVGLGHRRLSIIDLSPAGHQPMSYAKERYWITYNGEVYNYRELRIDLEAKGYVFSSQTDTEVILAAYAEWEEECVQKFNGMWAFAIWDVQEQRLFCSRDHFGIKPFYYYWDGRTFLFASEIKALLVSGLVEKRPNDQTIYEYLAYGYMDHTEETFFQGVKRLLPAHSLIIDSKEHAPKINRYWDLHPDRELKGLSDKQYAESFYELFEDSIRLRLRSDVPVGTCLSGGLDSSSIVCVVNKLMRESGVGRSIIGEKQKTFSSCFEDKRYDERKYIQCVLKQTGAKANFIFPKGEELLDLLSHIMWHQEEPFGSTSIYAQWHVMKMVKEQGVKVLLDGQGADEIVAGYHVYFVPYFADLLKRMNVLRAFNEIKIYSERYTISRLDLFTRALKLIVPDEVKVPIKYLLGKNTNHPPEWINPDFASAFSSPIQNSCSVNGKQKGFLNSDLYRSLFSLFLPSYLRYEDKNSMAYSIETRLPFLDHRLVEFTARLPVHQKISNGMTKSVLRNALKGVLPEEVRLRTDKMGFVTPEETWIKTTQKRTIEEIFLSDDFSKSRYFNQKTLIETFQNYCQTSSEAASTRLEIWRALNLYLWTKVFQLQ